MLVGYCHPDGRRVTREILAEAGAAVTEVADPEALRGELRGGGQGGVTFDLVVLDEHLLGMDGAGGRGLMEALSGHGPVLVLVSVAASVRDSRWEAWLGAFATLTKPLRRFRLLECVRRLLGRAVREETGPGASCRRDQVLPLRILLVDDLESNRRLAAVILERAGHRLVMACHGGEALDHLCPGKPRIDLVLMDLQMPVMDGFETTRRIRHSAPGEIDDPSVPIVVVTANPTTAIIRRCRQAAMDGFLAKPYRADELLAAINPFVQRRSLGRGASLPSFSPTPATIPDGSSPSHAFSPSLLPSSSPLSGRPLSPSHSSSSPSSPSSPSSSSPAPSLAAPSLGPGEGDPDAVRDWRGDFLVRWPSLVTELWRVLEARNLTLTLDRLDAVRDLAHKIGADRLASQALRLRGGVELGDWSHVASTRPKLEGALRQAVWDVGMAVVRGSSPMNGLSPVGDGGPDAAATPDGAGPG
ncbi:MAG: response regulator [Magnetococcales bacterium]|nr:response regulator [Magnetococcales bacterium]